MSSSPGDTGLGENGQNMAGGSESLSYEDLEAAVTKQRQLIQRQQQRFADLLKLHRKSAGDRETIQKLKAERDELSIALSSAKDANSVLNEEVGELKQNLSETESRIGPLLEQISHLEAQLAQAHQQITESQVDFEMLRTRAHVALQLRGEVDAASALKSVEETVLRGEQESDVFVSESSTTSASEEKAFSQISAWEAEHQSLRQKFQRLHDEFREATRRLEVKHEEELRRESERADHALRSLRMSHTETDEVSQTSSVLQRELREEKERRMAELRQKDAVISKLQNDLENARLEEREAKVLAENIQNASAVVETKSTASSVRDEGEDSFFGEEAIMKLAQRQAERDAELEQLKSRIGELTEQLNAADETESLRDLQQEVLKKEILELQRGQSRASVEIGYVKQIVLKFLLAGEEKQRLLPVMATLLQFSPDEVKQIEAKPGWFRWS